MNSRWMAMLALASLLPASSLIAQEAIQPGAWVRLTAPDVALRPITGIVSTVDSASITLADAEGRAGPAIRLASIHRIEVARGSRSNAGRGAVIGTVIGGVVGLAGGIAAASDNNSSGGFGDLFDCNGGCVVAITASGAAFGAGIGALIGAAIHSTRWEKASAPRVSLMPQPGGFVLALSLKL